MQLHIDAERLPPAGLFAPPPPEFEVRWAQCEQDVRDAQRLRYRIFAQELGARLTPVSAADAGFDIDRFDPFCDHLLVRTMSARGDPGDGKLIGTYRVMTPYAARLAGGFYTDTEFDLRPLRPLRAHAVELGRSCVHAGWRSGGVIMAMWRALGHYMLKHGLDTMIGCASIGLGDEGHAARALWQTLRHGYLVAPQWQVLPHFALPLDAVDPDFDRDTSINISRRINLINRAIETPPLIKGYLRCGARLLGPPALDLAFNTADLPMMLRFDELSTRYRKHFLGI